MNELNAQLAIALLLATAIAIAIDLGRDARKLVSARNVFLLSMASWYLVEAIILPDKIREYTQQQYNLGVLGVGLCLASFLTIYHSVRSRLFDPMFVRLAMVDRPQVLWRVFLIALAIGFVPMLVIARGDVIAILREAFVPSARWSSLFQRGRYGGLRDAFLELQMFLRAAIPLAAAIFIQKRFPSNQRFLAFLFLAYMFARAFNSGARSQVIEVFLPIAAAIYWTLSIPMKRIAIQFGLPIVAVVTLVWSAATVVTRNSGNFDLDKATEASYVGFEMFRELVFLQETVPERSEYRLGHTYYVQLVNPIPRFLWPGKPTGDAGLLLAGLQGQVKDGEASLTISPGLIGEMHWNFGTLGIIALGGLLGFIANGWDRIEPLAERSIVAFTVYAAGLAIIFLSGRSVNMSTLYGLIALVVLLILFTKK